MTRYQRQTILPQVKIDGQNKISSAKVLIVGAGGLGHPVASYLAAAGVGFIGIIDGDKISISNLPRQFQFHESDIGKQKATCLKEKLQKNNSDIEINAYDFFLEEDNAEKLFLKYQIIIDCCDNYSTKYLINDFAMKLNLPMVYGSAVGLIGQATVFTKETVCFRCIQPEKPIENHNSCQHKGVLGPIVGVIGSLQAQATLHLILKNPDLSQFTNKFYFMDLEQCDVRFFKINRAKNCKNHNEIKHITQPKEISKSSEKKIIVDIRSESDWNSFHLSESIHWPFFKIKNGDFPHTNDNIDYQFICDSGLLAFEASLIAKEHGHTHFSYIREGIYEYSNK